MHHSFCVEWINYMLHDSNRNVGKSTFVFSILAMTPVFQRCGILTSVDSDEPV